MTIEALAQKPIDRVLAKIPDAKRSGDGWVACCPAHDDNSPSLSITEGEDGRALLHCHAGCSTLLTIVPAIGLEVQDLFIPRPSPGGKIVATYDYCDAGGEVEFQVVRYDPKRFLQRRPDGNGDWIWSVKGCKTLLYRLPELNANPEATVYFCEGEKDADNAASRGLVATCSPTGACKFRKQHAEQLVGRDVVILPDNDEAGRRHVEKVATMLQGKAKSIRVVDLPDLPPKGDLSDWLDSGGTVEDLQTLVDETDEYAPSEPSASDAPKPIEKFTFGELAEQYPDQNPPVVDGLFREGETINIISNSKVGKSWFAYDLALAIVNGHYWHKRPTSQGKVLIVDNELHRNTLADRIPKVARRMGVAPGSWESNLAIWPLRGDLRPLSALAGDFYDIEPGEFKLIILDARYRFAEPGASENDNYAEAQFYNWIDAFAKHTRAAFALIHHASKGEQSGKRVTDVGAGAGSQSRAADCHLVLREHEVANAVIMEAAVRSFAPVQPIGLRWDFPVWQVDDTLDPHALKGRNGRAAQERSERDEHDRKAIVAALLKEPMTARQVRTLIKCGKDRVQTLLDGLLADGHIGWREIRKNNNKCPEFFINEQE